MIVDTKEMDIVVKSEPDKLSIDLVCDDDQHMASNGKGTKNDANLKEIDEHQEQSTGLKVKSDQDTGVEICMEYGPKKRRINSSCSIFENKELIEKAMTKLAKEEDECRIFGRYVASVMRSLASETLKRKLKKRIQQVLLEMTDEEEKLPDITPKLSYISTGYSPAI